MLQIDKVSWRNWVTADLKGEPKVGSVLFYQYSIHMTMPHGGVKFEMKLGHSFLQLWPCEYLMGNHPLEWCMGWTNFSLWNPLFRLVLLRIGGLHISRNYANGFSSQSVRGCLFHTIKLFIFTRESCKQVGWNIITWNDVTISQSEMCLKFHTKDLLDQDGGKAEFVNQLK